MLQTHVQLITPVSVNILKTLPEGIILHAKKTLGGPVEFHDISDKETNCVGIVSQPYLNILNNIFSQLQLFFINMS